MRLSRDEAYAIAYVTARTCIRDNVVPISEEGGAIIVQRAQARLDEFCPGLWRVVCKLDRETRGFIFSVQPVT